MKSVSVIALGLGIGLAAAAMIAPSPVQADGSSQPGYGSPGQYNAAPVMPRTGAVQVSARSGDAVGVSKTITKTMTVTFEVQLNEPLPENTILWCWTTANFYVYDENGYVFDYIGQNIYTEAVLVNKKAMKYSCTVTNDYDWSLKDEANTRPRIFYGAQSSVAWRDGLAWTGKVSKMPSKITAPKLTF